METKNKDQRIEELLTSVITEAEQQYIKESTLNNKEVFVENYVKTYLNENEPELLEEGWKEIALALGMLANVTLAPPVRAQAQQQLKKPQIVQQVNTVLHNPRAMDIAIDALEDQGYKDAEEKIENNADQIKDRLAKKGYRLKQRKDVAAKELGKYVRMGYSITKVQSDTIYKKVQQIEQVPAVVDSIKANLDMQDFFSEGAYVLSAEGKEAIEEVVTQIHQQNGVVLAVRVESSTDKQRVSDNLQQQLAKGGYSADNQGLSKARNDAVKKALADLQIDPSLVDQNILAEQGAGEAGAAEPQDPSARYVKLIIEAVQVTDESEAAKTSTDTVSKVVNTFDIAKAYTKEKAKKGWPSLKIKFPKSYKKVKVSKKAPAECEVWGK